MIYAFRPLGPWTEGDTPNRRGAHVFKASWSSTLTLLGRELDHLDARNVVVQVDVREHQLRADGMLRADAKMGPHPGVRIAFDSQHGPLTYATDAYENGYYARYPGWQANIRAVALGLEALRAVDRYGITRRAEQYQGWAQLPAGAGALPTGMTKLDAVRLVAKHAGVEYIASLDINDPAAMRLHFRRARANAHPDRTGGDSTSFLELEKAGQLLGLIA